MCPACFASVALMAAGATSVGGLGVLVARKLLGAKNAGPKPKPTEIESCSTQS